MTSRRSQPQTIMFNSAIRPQSSFTTRIWNLPIRCARPPLGLAVLAAGVVRQGTGAVYEDALAGVGVTNIVEFAFKVVVGAFTAFLDLVLDFIHLADDAVGGADTTVVQGLGEKDGESESFVGGQSKERTCRPNKQLSGWASLGLQNSKSSWHGLS
jgi:hypothetical protein